MSRRRAGYAAIGAFALIAGTGCASPQSSATAPTIVPAPAANQIARRPNACTGEPVFYPTNFRTLHADSVRFRVVSGLYTVTSSNTASVTVQINPTGTDPQEFDITGIKKPGRATITVTDTASGLSRKFSVGLLAFASPASKAPRSTCPDGPDFYPATLQLEVQRYRVVSGPFTVSVTGNSIRVSTDLNEFLLQATDPGSDLAHVTVTDTATGRSHTFFIHLWKRP